LKLTVLCRYTDAMCGVFGIVSTAKDAGEQVFAGLKRLEYRGYDSWGIATFEPKLRIQKGIGKISEASPSFPRSSRALGHTRWATHGRVSKKNAHPHTHGRVTLVHNGVAENFEALKKQLPKNCTLISETDSEVLAAMLDTLLSQHDTPINALRTLAQKIQGRYSLVVAIDGYDGLYALRRGSPLIIGRGENVTYIASDIPAFLAHTHVVNYLDDEEVAHLTATRVTVYQVANGATVPKRNVTVTWNLEEASKLGYPHFMLKEILEQKATIRNTLHHSNDLIDAFVRTLHDASDVYIIGSGTAHKAAMVGEYLFARIAHRKVIARQSEEMRTFLPFVTKDSTLLTISQSGETADALEVLECAQKRKSRLLSITNTPSSSIARMSHHHLPLQCGIEKAVASTKAMTAQMALLLLCAYASAKKLSQGKRILTHACAQINDLFTPRYVSHVKAVATKIATCENLFIIGRDALYPIALEAAIKIQEVSYIHAQGFAAGELKHGPIALIEKGSVCIVLGDDPETLTNAHELRARGATLIGISQQRHALFTHWLRAPDCAEAQPIATVIPVQLLAYFLACARGINPDTPRNLAKSVTVK